MNHPTHEELLGYLEGELPPQRQAEVAAHVGACDECRARTASWQSARSALASWTLPEHPLAAAPTPDRAVVRSPWRRAATAAALVAAGFGLALLAAPAWDSARDRAELASDMLRHLQEELQAELARFTANQQATQEQFLTALNGRLDELELQWLVDYVALRRDVETVAIGAQEGLRRLAGGQPLSEDAR